MHRRRAILAGICVVVLTALAGAGKAHWSGQTFALRASRVIERGLVRSRGCGPMLAGARGALCGYPSRGNVTSAAELASWASIRSARHDARAIRTLAAIDLVWSDSTGKSIDRAISSLQNLRARNYRPAETSVDLSAAYVQRGGRSGSALDYAEAIEAAAMSLEFDETIQAQRNLLLALSRMGIHADTTQMPAIDAQQVLYAALDGRLPEWGAAVQSRRASEANQILHALRESAHTIRDQTVRDLLNVIDSADSVRLNRLADAFRAFGEGRAAYVGSRYADAVPLFEAAAAPGIEPLASWAAAFRSASLVYTGDTEAGAVEMKRLVDAVDGVHYPSLAGRVHWMLGTTLLSSGRYESALERYERACALFSEAGEQEHLGAVQYLRSETLFTVGSEAAGYIAALEALRTLALFRGSQWRHNLLLITARRLAELDLNRAALLVQSAGVETAQRSGRKSSHAEALIARAKLHARAGRAVDAKADLQQAMQIVETLPPGLIRGWQHADTRLVLAAIQRAEGAPISLTALDSVVTFAESTDNIVRLMQARIARAGAHATRGAVAAAMEDLQHVTAALQTQRATLNRVALRASLTDASAAVFDQLIRLQVQQGDVAGALATLRRSRGTLRPERSTQQATVTFAVPGDTLLVWIESAKGLQFHQSPTDRKALHARIARVTAALELRDEAALPDLTALHTLLIAPIMNGLAGMTSVTIEADRQLAAVPFAALRNARDGRYLVEDFTLSHRQPTNTTRRTTAKTAAGTTLIVTDPAFDQRAFPTLDRLRGAEHEAAVVAAVHTDPVVLAGPIADRAALQRTMPNARLLHFAGHALFDARNPDQSRLVLAGRDGTASITAAEIRALDLSRLRLAVLSACQSVRTTDGRSGFGGLASAFLDAGAGGVIGSLWRVDDDATTLLMAAMHRYYAREPDAPAALRAAQLELLHTSEARLQSPATWAGFVYATQ